MYSPTTDKNKKKGTRGIPDIWDEVKKKVTMTLTPKAVTGLDALASEFKLSRSEFVERVGRGIIQVVKATDDQQEQ